MTKQTYFRLMLFLMLGSSSACLNMVVHAEGMIAPDGLLITAYGYAAPSGVTLVPVRGIAEWCGAVVSFDSKTNTIVCKGTESTVTLTLGERKAQVVNNNGPQIITLTQPATVIDGVTLVPLRFVGEAFGCKIDYTPSWDPDSPTGVLRLPVAILRLDTRTAGIPIYTLPPNDIAAMRRMVLKTADNAWDLIAWPVDVYGIYAKVGARTFEDGHWISPSEELCIARRTRLGRWEEVAPIYDMSKREMDNMLKKGGMPRNAREHFLKDWDKRFPGD